MSLRGFFRKFALYSLAGLLGLVVLYGVGRFIHVWSDSYYDGARAPYLQMVSSSAVSLRWQTTEPHLGRLRYGLSPDALEQELVAPHAGVEHELRLFNLSPDTRYYYAIYQGEQRLYGGPQYWFHTAPRTGETRPLRIWVTGDQGEPGAGQERVRDAALAWVAQNPRPGLPGVDIWVTTGDNAYTSGSNRQFQRALFEPYREILRQTPFWPAYGNHDARRWVFFNIFSFPTRGEAGGMPSGTENYYSFDYGNLHVLMLDSEASDLRPGSPMLAWLERDLAATRQPWKIAVLHHPPYTKGSHDSDNPRGSGGRMQRVREHLVPLLEQHGVQLVLTGHSHMYERSWLLQCHYGSSDTLRPHMIVNPAEQPGARYVERGTLYAVVGSSGKLDNGPLNHPALPFSRHALGSLMLDIEDEQLRGQFIDDQGRIQDHFILQNVDAMRDRLVCGE